MTSYPKYKGQEQIEQTHRILWDVIQEYRISQIFLLFSGGYDSLVTTDLSYNILLKAAHNGYGNPIPKVVHVNTGIGVPQTREFVRKTVSMLGWPFAEYETPERYEDIIREHGFPGPASHRFMYIRLKERALDTLARDHTASRDERKALLLEVIQASRGMSIWYLRVLYAALQQEYQTFKREREKRLLFVTGVRKQESVRRMGHVKEVQEQGRRVWVAPLLGWAKNDLLDYMQSHLMPRNPVVDTLHKSGECLCGSFAHQGELEEIEFWYPETGAYIRDLEKMVKAEGFVWGWEEAPPSWWGQMRAGQEFLPGFSPLCSSCEKREEDRCDLQG